MGPREQRTRRFVEPDVAIRSEAEKLHVDTAGAGDRVLVARALARRIRRHPVQHMNAAGRQVDVIEQVPAHERVIAAPVVRRDADELVEVERGRPAEIDPAGAKQPHELAIQRNRRAAGREPEDDRRIGSERARDVGGERSGDRRRRRENANTQRCLSYDL